MKNSGARRFLTIILSMMVIAMGAFTTPREALAGDPPVDTCGEFGTSGLWFDQEECEFVFGMQVCGLCEYYCPTVGIWVLEDSFERCVYDSDEGSCYDWQSTCDNNPWFYLYYDFRNVYDWKYPS